MHLMSTVILLVVHCCVQSVECIHNLCEINEIFSLFTENSSLSLSLFP